MKRNQRITMIAIPLTDKNSTILSKDFESASFFALLDTTSGHFRTIKTTSDILDIFEDNQIDSTIAYDNEDVLESIAQKNIEVYSSCKTALTLEEIYRQAVNKKFKKMYS